MARVEIDIRIHGWGRIEREFAPPVNIDTAPWLDAEHAAKELELMASELRVMFPPPEGTRL